MTYWLPYHIQFAQLTQKRDRGKQISLMMATSALLGIFTPIVAGVIIIHFGFSILFLIVIILLLLSGIPFRTIPPAHEKYTWSYKKTWQQFFAKKNRGLIVPLFADGAENIIGLAVWPIFIFEILNGSYLEVGAVSTFIIGATIIVQLSTGKYIDQKTQKGGVIKLSSIFYSFGWVLKIFVVTAFHIFAVGVYHSVMRIFMRTSFDTLVYEIAADQGHYIDEFTTLREITINMGKVLTLGVVILVSFYVPIVWAFAFAAAASLVLNMLSSKHIVLESKS